MCRVLPTPRRRRRCWRLKGTKLEILFLLIPVSVVFVALIAAVFLWAVKAGQFEDMEGPAQRVVMDDDRPAKHYLPGEE